MEIEYAPSPPAPGNASALPAVLRVTPPQETRGFAAHAQRIPPEVLGALALADGGRPADTLALDEADRKSTRLNSSH